MAPGSRHAVEADHGAESANFGSTRFAVLDVVRLARERPGDGLPAGATGTIVEVFECPEPAYEVEFLDTDGGFLAEIPVAPEDLSLVARPTSRTAQ